MDGLSSLPGCYMSSCYISGSYISDSYLSSCYMSGFCMDYMHSLPPSSETPTEQPDFLDRKSAMPVSGLNMKSDVRENVCDCFEHEV